MRSILNFTNIYIQGLPFWENQDTHSHKLQWEGSLRDGRYFRYIINFHCLPASDSSPATLISVSGWKIDGWIFLAHLHITWSHGQSVYANYVSFVMWLLCNVSVILWPNRLPVYPVPTHSSISWQLVKEPLAPSPTHPINPQWLPTLGRGPPWNTFCVLQLGALSKWGDKGMIILGALEWQEL